MFSRDNFFERCGDPLGGATRGCPSAAIMLEFVVAEQRIVVYEAHIGGLGFGTIPHHGIG